VLSQAKVMLVGCGSMGLAMIKGWASAGVGDKHYTIVTPHESSVMPLRAICDISWYASPQDLPRHDHPDLVVLAVKPQSMDKVLKDYKTYATQGAIMISVAAGRSLDSYRPYLGETAKLIRVMPNLPVAYNKGMTFGYACPSIESLDLSLAHELFSCLGKMLWLESEPLFDPASALSGCGPAYLYLLADSLTQAGIKAGLEPDIAETLARQTMIGAGVLLDHTTDSAQILKKKVASPGGVTEAALQVLEHPETGLPSLMINAINAAVKRSRELANG
jgi:pyrroline-5-carboxylate reductase